MNKAGQEGACGQHHGFRTEAQAQLSDYPVHPVLFDQQIVHRLLKQPKIWLVFQSRTDRLFVEQAIRLGSCGSHRRAFAGVQDPELDTAFICGGGHSTTQGIHFFDQMPFAYPADRRVAGHLPERLYIVAEQQGLAACACASQGRLGTCMASAHHDHIEYIRKLHVVAALKRTRIIPQLADNPKQLVSRETISPIFRCRTG